MASFPSLEPVPRDKPQPVGQASEPHFRTLLISGRRSLAVGRSATTMLSLLAHAALISVVVVVPLLLEDVLPAPGESLRAFFVAPPEVAPPAPPPPPPSAAGARRPTRASAATRPSDRARFIAPVEVPDEVLIEDEIELGVAEGVPGGVEGGLAGGVLGGIVGGLPLPAPPPAPRPVRVGGAIVPPRLIHRVQPEYPELALQARLGALIILEAHVDTRGRVKSVKVLRGSPLFDQAAIDAVRQWRYRPLLLNGQPTEFLVSVTVTFHLTTSQEP